ncbi:MAG: hypothetical protein HFE64_02865 [Lachnospiraceae bacterium]|nr:hypothetical protein [Lachnospiraceae bacterium]
MYIDLYFISNWILDSWILRCVSKNYGVRRMRIYLSAGAGALGACLWKLGNFPDMLGPVVALPLSALMLFFCIGRRPKQQWRQAFFKLYMYSFFMAGLIPIAGQYISLWIGSVLVAYIGLKAAIYFIEKKHKTEMSIQIVYGEKVYTLKALVDSGNLLREPVKGQPVVVVKASVFESEKLQASWPIPYHTIQGEGILFGFWPKEIRTAERRYKENEVMVGISEKWDAKGYEALIPEILVK